MTFRDVAGLDTAKEELLEVVACLRDARRYARLNAKTPSGVLLTGPPGTGKTLLGATAIGNCALSLLPCSHVHEPVEPGACMSCGAGVRFILGEQYNSLWTMWYHPARRAGVCMAS